MSGGWGVGRNDRAETARRALADQALSVLAGAQDGAIGAGLPAAFDSARARWGPLSPPVSAYVARVLLREHALDRPWPARLQQLLHWLAGVQRADGLIQDTTLASPSRRGGLVATGNALSAWCDWQREHDDSRIARAIIRSATTLADLLAHDPARACARHGVVVPDFLPAAEAARGLLLAGQALDRPAWREIAARQIDSALAHCDDTTTETVFDVRTARALDGTLEAAMRCQTVDAVTRIARAFDKRLNHGGLTRRIPARDMDKTRRTLAAAALARSLQTAMKDNVVADRRTARRVRGLKIQRIASPGAIDHCLTCDSLADLVAGCRSIARTDTR